jgi:phosphoglycolate phosphatase-like HAD superfamily hydrolase
VCAARRLIAQRLGDRSGAAVPTLEEVTKAFEAIYQGGLWKTETLLVEPQLIADLAARYPLAVVTGRPRTPDAERFLSHFGLRRHFSAMVCMGETAQPKPDPGPCLAALQQLGVGGGGKDVLMIGDTVDDIAAGNGCGCTSLGVPAPGHDTAEEHQIFARVGAAMVLSQGLPELRALLEHPPPRTAAAAASGGGGGPKAGRWSLSISRAAGGGGSGGVHGWSVRIAPRAAVSQAAVSQAARLEALVRGIAACEQRLASLETSPRSKGGAAAAKAAAAAAPVAGGGARGAPVAAAAAPSPPGFFTPELQWARFGSCAGAATLPPAPACAAEAPAKPPPAPASAKPPPAKPPTAKLPPAKPATPPAAKSAGSPSSSSPAQKGSGPGGSSVGGGGGGGGGGSSSSRTMPEAIALTSSYSTSFTWKEPAVPLPKGSMVVARGCVLPGCLSCVLLVCPGAGGGNGIDHDQN